VPDGKGGAVSITSSLEQKSQTKNLGAKSTSQQGEETKEEDSMDSSSSEDSQESEQRFVQPLSTDPLKQEHIDAVGGPGQLLCFLQVYDNEPVLGVPAKDVDKARIFGTCIMSDGQYQTFTCHALGVAAATCVKEPYTRLCPRRELRQLILQRLKDKRAMRHDIDMVESDFKIRMRRATKKQKSADAIANKQKADAGADGETQEVKDLAAVNPLAVAPSAEVAKDAEADGVKLLAQIPQEDAAATAEAGAAVDPKDAAAQRPLMGAPSAPANAETGAAANAETGTAVAADSKDHLDSKVYPPAAVDPKDAAAVDSLDPKDAVEVANDAEADGVKLLAQILQEGAAATAEAGTAVDPKDAAAQHPLMGAPSAPANAETGAAANAETGTAVAADSKDHLDSKVYWVYAIF
jgi:hypothetical protein